MRLVRKDSASSRSKCAQVVLTGPCLRPVMDHRTHPVPIPEEVDLSGIDRTLGGSVRLLPPERPVIGSHASSGLFSVSFSVTSGDLFYSAVPSFLISRDLALVLAAASTARQPRAAVLLPRRTTAAHPRQRHHASTARASLARARPAPVPAARHHSSPRRCASPRATVPLRSTGPLVTAKHRVL